MTIFLADLAVLALILLAVACVSFAVCVGLAVAEKVLIWLADRFWRP